MAEDLERPNFFVEWDQCRGVVTNSIRLSNDTGFGFDIGLSSPLPMLGVISHVIMSCRTIMHTQEPWVRYGKPLAGIAGRFEFLGGNDNDVELGIISSDEIGHLIRFDVEESIGLAMSASQALTGEPMPLRTAAFAYAPPAYAERYREVLGCPVHFNAPCTILTTHRSWVEQGLQYHDEEFHRLCLQHCDDLLQRLGGAGPIESALRAIFLHDLPELPGLEAVAKRLAMSPRTLRRRLSNEGTSFRLVLEQFRNDRARSLLRSGLSTKQVAMQLGFQEPSALRHSFRAWNGMTVSEYRAALPVITE